MVDAVLDGAIDDAYVVPISISYDRVIETGMKLTVVFEYYEAKETYSRI